MADEGECISIKLEYHYDIINDMVKNNKVIMGSSSIKVTFGGSVTFGMIIQLGIRYFVSAIHFKNLAIESEKSKEHEKYELYCINSVIMSYLALEAFINEFFMDAVLIKEELGKHFDKDTIELIASHSVTLLRSENTIEKYQYVLLLARKKAFVPGTLPYQAVDDLESLRNALIHFKPELDTDQKQHTKLEARLSGKFAFNPFLDGTGNPIFPSKCFSVGCAEWAIKSVSDFVNAFYDKLGIISVLEYHKDTIKNWT